MTLSYIVLLDFISAVGFALALFFTLRIDENTFDRNSRLFISLCFTIYLFVSVSNILEHSKITDYFDRFEDHFELLFIPFFLFFIYSIQLQKELKERQQSKTKYRLLFESFQASITIFDFDGRLLMMNEAGAKLMNGEPHDFIGKSMTELFPDTVATFMERNRQIIESGVGRDFEDMLELPTGRRWFWSNLQPVRDIEGKIKAVQIVSHDITERKEAELALKFRLEFETLINTISTSFINLPKEAIDKGIQRAISTIGDFAGADRCYVFQFNTNLTSMDNTIEWCAEDVEPHIDKLKSIPAANFPWLMEKFQRSEVVHIPQLSSLPESAFLEMEHLEEEGVQSLINLPMVYGGKLIGFLGFDSVKEEKAFSSDFIALLKIVGEIIANALMRKQAEEDLQETEERFRSVVQTATDAIITVNSQGKIVFWNFAAEKAFGYSVSEALGKPVTIIMPQNSHEAHRLALSSAVNTEEIKMLDKTIELIGRKKDGREFPLELSVAKWGTRGEVFITGIIRDITERKLSEAAIQALVAGTVGTTGYDCFNKIVRGLCDWLNLDCAIVGELVDDKTIKTLSMHLDGEFVEDFSYHLAGAPCGKVIKEGYCYYPEGVIDLFHEDKDIVELKAEAYAGTPLVGKNNEVIGVLCVISRRKQEALGQIKEVMEIVAVKAASEIERMRAEEALKQAKADLERQNIELKALDKMKDGLIRDVTHELKTPVAKQNMQVDIFKRMIQRLGLTGDFEKIIKTMEAAIRRQESVIHNILDLSRLEAGGRKYQKNSVRLDKVIKNAINDYQLTIDMNEVEVELNIAQVTIESDEEMLFHVFSNIINNAIKFRQKEKPANIKIFLEKGEKKITITVEDNGIGMTETQQKQAFERFFQATASSEGSGVGLNITRMIVSGLGGNISLESDGPDKGTTVRVEFGCVQLEL